MSWGIVQKYQSIYSYIVNVFKFIMYINVKIVYIWFIEFFGFIYVYVMNCVFGLIIGGIFYFYVVFRFYILGFIILSD